MACGDKYRKKIQTANGYTLENLCGSVCVTEDYDAWKNTADTWMGYVKNAWEALVALTPDKPIDEQLNRDVNTYIDSFEKLPSSLFTSYFETGELALNPTWVERAAKNTADAACVLEQLEAAIVRAGGKTSPLPMQVGEKPEEKKAGGALLKWAPWIALGGVVLGAYVIWKVKP